MRTRIGVAVLLLMVSASVVPAMASTTELILSGSVSAYMDVTFAKPIRVHEPQAVATTKGRFAGFFMYRLGERPTPDSSSNTAGGVYTPRLATTDPGELAIPFGFRDTLAAGRYRVYLFADKSAVVRVPVDGLARTLRLVPRIHVHSGIDARDGSAVTDTTNDALSGLTEPVTIGTHTWAASVVEAYYTGVPNAYADNLKACVVPKGSTDCPKAVMSYGESVEFGIAVDVIWHVPPGDLKPGSYVALQKRLGVGTGARITGVAFWFDLV